MGIFSFLKKKKKSEDAFSTQNFQMPQIPSPPASYPQEQNLYPSHDLAPESPNMFLEKDLQLIISKLNAIEAKINYVTQKIENLEKEHQPTAPQMYPSLDPTRRKW